MTLRALAAVALTATLVACDSGASFDVDNPPPVIASAAFDLGAGSFPDEPARTGVTARVGSNFVNASARVGIVTAVIGLHLALPAAATEAATEADPVVTDGVWTWASTADVFGTPVDVTLEAIADGSEIDWRLVSQRRGDEPGEPFVYYTATTSLDGETGTWTLFNPDQDGPVLTASFDVRDLDDREVTFRVPAGRENGGSSVLYRTDGDAQTFDWLDQPEDERALIVWDRASKAGSIEADTYNGGEPACWDAALDNVAC